MQVSGTLTLSGSRTLTVTAAGKCQPAHSDARTTGFAFGHIQLCDNRAGTAQLNASGQYDATNGYSGTITNNAGTVIHVTKPVGGTLTGTITAGGTATATLNGDFVYYSDDTSQSSSKLPDGAAHGSCSWGLPPRQGPTVGRALDLTAGSGVVEACPTSGSSVRFDGGAVAYAEPLPVLALTNYGAGHYDPNPGSEIGIGIGYGEVSGALHGLCVALFDRA